MAYGRDYILYRRNVLPPDMRYGKRVMDSRSGFLTKEGYCMKCNEGLINPRMRRPDIDPKTGNYVK